MKRARVFGHLPRNARVTLTRDAVNPRGMELREIKEYFRPRRTLVAPANKSEICQPFYSRRANTPRESGKERCAATRETLRCGQREEGREREREGGREREKKKKNVCGARGLHGERGSQQGPCTQTILAEHAPCETTRGLRGGRREIKGGGGCVRARLGQEKVFLEAERFSL